MRACGPWDCGPETYVFPDAEGPVFPEGNNSLLREFSWGEEGTVSGGVFDHSTHEEDGPGTWETLAAPRRIPGLRRAGDPSPTHDAEAGTRGVGLRGPEPESAAR